MEHSLMHRLFVTACFLVTAQAATVEFEMMTWPELKPAIHAEGKTTVLVYNGGTEQRGPQNVAGGHTLMGRATAKAIAEKLGNAIVAPVMPFSVNNADHNLPGTIGLTPELFAALNEQVAEQLVQNGFQNIVLMGDHGGGQKQLAEVAEKLDHKYSSQGIRVVYCDDVYKKANEDFDKWLDANGYPRSAHAGIPDTSEMLYLGGDKAWVRKNLIASALGDPPAAPGQQPERKINNGITGDARRSTVALGKRAFEMKVDYAVSQIRRLLAPK
jgi:creatinine amidohydrolase